MSIITKEIVVTDFKGPRHVWNHDCVFSICPQFTCQPGWNRMASFSGTSSVHSTFDLGHSVQPFLPAACGHTRPGIEDCPQRSPQGKEGRVPECLSRTYDVQSTSHVLSSLETQSPNPKKVGLPDGMTQTTLTLRKVFLGAYFVPNTRLGSTG